MDPEGPPFKTVLTVMEEVGVDVQEYREEKKYKRSLRI